MDHRLNCEDSLLRTSLLSLLWMEHELFSVSETQGLVLCSLLIRWLSTMYKYALSQTPTPRPHAFTCAHTHILTACPCGLTMYVCLYLHPPPNNAFTLLLGARFSNASFTAMAVKLFVHNHDPGTCWNVDLANLWWVSKWSIFNTRIQMILTPFICVPSLGSTVLAARSLMTRGVLYVSICPAQVTRLGQGRQYQVSVDWMNDSIAHLLIHSEIIIPGEARGQVFRRYWSSTWLSGVQLSGLHFVKEFWKSLRTLLLFAPFWLNRC